MTDERPQIEDDKPKARKSREIDDRAHEARVAETFVPPSLLPEIKKHPQYEYRWVRVSTLGNSDNPNMSMKQREGWVPVSADEHPEIVQFHSDERFKGLIEHGGLILCKISKEKYNAKGQYLKKKSASQLEAVDNDFMRLNDKRMPLFREGQSRVKRGG